MSLRVAVVLAALSGAACQSILGIGETTTVTTDAPLVVPDATPDANPSLSDAPLVLSPDATLLDFQVTIDPASLYVVRGVSPARLSLMLTRQSGFTAPVEVALLGLPADVQASGAPFSGTETAGFISVTANGSADLGATTLTLRATSGAEVQDVPVTLTVGDPPGVIDTSFNAGEADLEAAGPLDQVVAMAIDSQQRIVLGIVPNGGSGSPTFVLARLLPSGQPDPLFGPLGNGIVVGPSGLITALALTSSDGVLVVGHGATGAVVAKYASSGALDASFAAASTVGAGVYVDATAVSTGGVAVQSTGAVVFAENTSGVGVRLCRLDVHGNLDTSYGSNAGCVPPQVVPSLFPTLLRADGDVVIGVGEWNDTSNDVDYFLFTRVAADANGPNAVEGTTYNPSGCKAMAGALVGARAVLAGDCSGVAAIIRGDETGVDSQFHGGAVLIDNISAANSSGFIAVAVQTDTKLVAAGFRDLSASTGVDAVVTRFTSAGAVDPSFGADGLAVVRPGGNPMIINAMALAADGRIVVAGHTAKGAAVVRLWP